MSIQVSGQIEFQIMIIKLLKRLLILSNWKTKKIFISENSRKEWQFLKIKEVWLRDRDSMWLRENFCRRNKEQVVLRLILAVKQNAILWFKGKAKTRDPALMKSINNFYMTSWVKTVLPSKVKFAKKLLLIIQKWEKTNGNGQKTVLIKSLPVYRILELAHIQSIQNLKKLIRIPDKKRYISAYGAASWHNFTGAMKNSINFWHWE